MLDALNSAAADAEKTMGRVGGAFGRPVKPPKFDLDSFDKAMETALEAQEKAESAKPRTGSRNLLSAATSAGSIMAAQVAVGATQQALSGGINSPQAATGIISQFASLLPGPLGAVAGIFVTVFGGIMGALDKQAAKTRANVGAAMESIIAGSRNAGQAAGDVRLTAMNEGLRTLNTELVRRAAGGNISLDTWDDVNLTSRETGRLINTSVQRIARDMTNAERAFQVVQERLRPLLIPLHTQRAQTAANERANEIARGAQQAGFQGAQIAAGMTEREASDAAARMAIAQQLAAQAGISLAEAQNRLAPQLAAVAEAQRNQRIAEGSRDLRRELVTPETQFQNRTRQLEEMFRAGAITEEERGRGLNAAINQLERAAGGPPRNTVNAMVEGSIETQRAINAARREQMRENREEVVRRAVQELRAVQEQQRDLAREANRLLRENRLPVVNI